MKKLLLLIVINLFLSISAFAQTNLFEKKVYAVNSDSLLYRILSPENVSKDRKYPLVIFLHGAGERGNDNEKQLTWGSQMFLNPINRAKYPAYVIYPQCPETSYWSFAERPKSFVPEEMPIDNDPTVQMKLVRGLINEYIGKGLVDPQRVYIIGLSMGGMAVYDLASRYPDLFASAVAICGAVNPSKLSQYSDIKWRIFHGDADTTVPVECSRKAYLALKKARVDVDYTEFVGCKHDSWNPAFNSPNFMKLLFQYSKPVSKK